jgi:ribosomal protein S18 acetylase RimI-like enzyme
MIREARGGDAAVVAALISELGFVVPFEDVAHRISQFGLGPHPVLIADINGPVGCLTWHMMPVLHRETQVGRISMLIVNAVHRAQGIGGALVDEAERRMVAAGCCLIEVTSNEKLVAAHDFYLRRGYERTSLRFAKKMSE